MDAVGDAAEFKRLLELNRVAADRFIATIPDGWQQGRGAFGGLVLGTLAYAMEEFLDDRDRSLRMLTGELCGPTLPGMAEIKVELLRQGSAVTTVAARLMQAEQVQAHAVAVLGKTRPTGHDWQPPPPLMPPFETATVLALPPAITPPYSRHFEFRPTGTAVLSGSNEALASGWVRHAQSCVELGAYDLLALIDTWWPALLSREVQFRPMATVAFAFQLLAPELPLPGERPIYYQARGIAAREGFTSELRELWDEKGRLLAINHQMQVIIR